MIDNKHISKIIIVLMALAVCLCMIAVLFSDKMENLLGGKKIKMEYETKLFDTSEIMTVDIQMDQEQWDKMLSSASSEEYYVCNVVINGLTVKNVGIRPKGNTSLSAIAMDPTTDRYSLKLEFDHFVSEQTCYGLDKLILNNNYADATNIKEALVYDMYQYIGADASLYNYAKVSVNGEYWGVYLALEGVEESFMLRNYGTQDGELYKPESLGMGGGNSSDDNSGFNMGNFNFGNFNFSDFSNMPSDMSNFNPGNIGDMSNFNTGNMGDKSDFNSGNMGDMSNFNPGNMGDMSNFNPGNMGDMSDFGGNFNEGNVSKIFGGSSSGNGGANLNYSDDKLDSYSTIWEGAITDTTKNDRRRVVTALKNISEGTDLETYLDVDNVLKYMAVHVFSVNMDSLSGSMAHNYYLYEYDGKLNVLPWDYNLSFGGMSMGGGSANDMINDAIDTPFSGTKFFDALLENEEYNKRYHEYLNLLVEEYVNGGRFDETYTRIRNQIDELVITDPTAFYNEEEYYVASEMIYKTVKLRAESISGQLAGEIPSTDEGQRQNAALLIDASEIDIAAMGQFNMGQSFGGGNKDTGESSFTRPSTGKSSFTRPSDGKNPGSTNTTDIKGTTDITDITDTRQFSRDSFGMGPSQTNSKNGIVVLVVCFVSMMALLLAVKVIRPRNGLKL